MFCKRLLLSLTLVLPVVAAGCGKDPEVAKREFLQSGDAFAQQKKFPEAIIQYRNAVQADPRLAEARVKLANLYLLTGDTANALSESVRAADLLPNDATAQLRAGTALLASGQFAEAESRADKAIAIDPKLVQAQLLKGYALGKLKKLDDAVRQIEEALQVDPTRMTGYSNLGAIYGLRGDPTRAEAAFRQAVRIAPNDIGSRLDLANFLWTANRNKEAEEQLKAALALDPNNLLANRAISLLYVTSGQAAQAEPFLKVIAERGEGDLGKLLLADYYASTGRVNDGRRVLETVAAANTSGSATAMLRLAGLGFSSGDAAAASRLVEQVLAKDPKNTEALLAKSQLLVRAGKLTDAAAVIQTAVQINAQSSQLQFALGVIRSARREDDAAITAFNEALNQNPRMARAELELAKVHLRHGRLTDAQKFAESAIAKVPRNPEAHLIVAQVALRQGNLAKAEPEIRALVKFAPNDPAILIVLGQLEASKKNTTAARTAFERVIDKNPANVEALDGLVTLNLAAGRRNEAKALMETASRKAPTDAAVLVLASRTYGAVGDFAGSERLALAAIQANPNNLTAYELLGQLYVYQGRLDEGLKQFTALTEKMPTSVSAHTMVAILLQAQNKPAEARKQYEKTLAINSRAGVAANNLAWMYTEDGAQNLDMALQLAKSAKAEMPDNSDVDDTLGWVYYKKGLHPMAIQSYMEALKKQPKNAWYHYHLGLAYVATVDTEKARAELQSALTLDPKFKGAADAQQVLASLKS